MALPDRPLLASCPCRSVTAATTSRVRTRSRRCSCRSRPTSTILPSESKPCASATHGAKEEHNAVGARTIMELGELGGPRTFGLASRLLGGLAARGPVPVNVVISNVPGPPFPLYLAGARLVSMLPLGPPIDGAGLNITVLSYIDRVDWGFIACRELAPHFQRLPTRSPTPTRSCRSSRGCSRFPHPGPASGRPRSVRSVISTVSVRVRAIDRIVRGRMAKRATDRDDAVETRIGIAHRDAVRRVVDLGPVGPQAARMDVEVVELTGAQTGEVRVLLSEIVGVGEDLGRLAHHRVGGIAHRRQCDVGDSDHATLPVEDRDRQGAGVRMVVEDTRNVLRAQRVLVLRARDLHADVVGELGTDLPRLGDLPGGGRERSQPFADRDCEPLVVLGVRMVARVTREGDETPRVAAAHDRSRQHGVDRILREVLPELGQDAVPQHILGDVRHPYRAALEMRGRCEVPRGGRLTIEEPDHRRERTRRGAVPGVRSRRSPRARCLRPSTRPRTGHRAPLRLAAPRSPPGTAG